MPKKSVAGTAHDPTIQFAVLKVDDAEYKLAYSFNAIAEAESKAGCNLLMGLESLANLSAIQLRGLLYAALTIAHEFTIEQAGALVRLDTIAPITAALAEAYMLSMPQKKTTTAEPEPAAKEAAQS